MKIGGKHGNWIPNGRDKLYVTSSHFSKPQITKLRHTMTLKYTKNTDFNLRNQKFILKISINLNKLNSKFLSHVKQASGILEQMVNKRLTQTPTQFKSS